MAHLCNDSDDVSYEFNTVGFYNELCDRFQENGDFLHKISSIANKRLQIRRDEFAKMAILHRSIQNTHSPRKTTPRPSAKNALCSDEQVHIQRQVITKTVPMENAINVEDDEEEEDLIVLDEEDLYEPEQLTQEPPKQQDTSTNRIDHDLLSKSNDNQEAQTPTRHISGLDSFINREPSEPMSEILAPSNVDRSPVKVPSAEQTFMKQSTGDDVVDQLLMKLTQDMTI